MSNIHKAARPTGKKKFSHPKPKAQSFESPTKRCELAVKFAIPQELRLRLNSKGDWQAYVSKSAGEFFLSPEILFLLQAVQRQTANLHCGKTAKKAMQSTLQNFPPDTEVEEILLELAQCGLLKRVELEDKGSSAVKSAQNLLQDGFADPWIQWAMLADSRRCQAYANAIQQALSKNKSQPCHVVDLGAGLGLLSSLAFRNGAQQVMAIEETAIGTKIPEILKAQGLPFQRPHFELQNTHSSLARITKETSLVVSELFGNDPFQEGILHSLRNFANRLYKAQKSGHGKKHAVQAQYIPQELCLHAEIRQLKGSAVFDRVQSWSHLRFASTREAAQGTEAAEKKEKKQREEKTNPIEQFMTHAIASLSWESLSFPVSLRPEDLGPVHHQSKLAEISLLPPLANQFHCAGSFRISQNFLDQREYPWVVLLWFRATLFDNITVSNHPEQQDFCNHWSPIVVPIAFPLVSTKKNNGLTAENSEHILVTYRLAETEDFWHMTIADSQGNILGKK